MIKMQEDVKELYIAISKVISKVKDDKGIKYTELCYENEIPMSTYDDIINAKTKATFYNIAKVVRGLGLNFEEFGKLLDKELPEEFFDNIH